jgi:hypothetical protein
VLYLTKEKFDLTHFLNLLAIIPEGLRPIALIKDHLTPIWRRVCQRDGTDGTPLINDESAKQLVELAMLAICAPNGEPTESGTRNYLNELNQAYLQQSHGYRLAVELSTVLGNLTNMPSAFCEKALEFVDRLNS